jgi:methylglutaconyl-CoA hydratase
MAINATEWYTAEWGKSRGLFHEVFATTEQLDAYLLHFVDKLKEMNPEALSGLKKVFWEGTDNWDTLLAERAAKSGQLVLSDFSKKTIRGFLKA